MKNLKQNDKKKNTNQTKEEEQSYWSTNEQQM